MAILARRSTVYLGLILVAATTALYLFRSKPASYPSSFSHLGSLAHDALSDYRPAPVHDDIPSVDTGSVQDHKALNRQYLRDLYACLAAGNCGKNQAKVVLLGERWFKQAIVSARWTRGAALSRVGPWLSGRRACLVSKQPGGDDRTLTTTGRTPWLASDHIHRVQTECADASNAGHRLHLPRWGKRRCALLAFHSSLALTLADDTLDQYHHFPNLVQLVIGGWTLDDWGRFVKTADNPTGIPRWKSGSSVSKS